MTTDWTTEIATVAGTYWPYKSQQETQTFDSAPPENQNLDCAPACMASVLQWVTGVNLPVDVVHDIAVGEGKVGITTIDQMVTFLSERCTIRSTKLTPNANLTGDGSLSRLVWDYTVKGLPLIGLQQFSDTVTTLHWRLFTGIDPTEFIVGEPWTGSRIVQSYSQATELFNKAAAKVGGRTNLLGMERRRDASL